MKKGSFSYEARMIQTPEVSSLVPYLDIRVLTMLPNHSFNWGMLKHYIFKFYKKACKG